MEMESIHCHYFTQFTVSWAHSEKWVSNSTSPNPQLLPPSSLRAGKNTHQGSPRVWLVKVAGKDLPVFFSARLPTAKITLSPW